MYAVNTPNNVELAWSLEYVPNLMNVWTVALMGKPERDLSGLSFYHLGGPHSRAMTFGFVQR
jgi:hypothetical protein